ncbi:MAG: hypothetical protein WBG53_01655 [Rhodococcus sp. (in: high G+C Gram-positive bacteria)]|mgnify:CR=1 FL=1
MATIGELDTFPARWPAGWTLIHIETAQKLDGMGQDAVPKLNRDGLPGWEIKAIASTPEGKKLMKFTVWDHATPALPDFAPIRLVGDALVIHPWATAGKSGARGGFWYEVQGVEPLDGTSVAAPKKTGAAA